MANDNTYERNIRGIADEFRLQTGKLVPHIRGGDRPPFTKKLTARDLQDPFLAEKAAQSMEQRGFPHVAATIRARASKIMTPNQQGSVNEGMVLRPPG